MKKTKPQRRPTPIYIRPTPELRARLDAQCEKERRSIHTVVSAALEQYFASRGEVDAELVKP